ncbi:Alpha/Beta hydrolase protein [Aspergillus avenaceus]|uniref:Alpha/Beta hydrolase protein n=1 Tax=Aspergillus avenaceus TaxID=36643 RepID=A0A5N6TT58_ASPAV|nr:Alpha/Beta hydrolase protein [Aspergillus avenaceus]
MLKAWAMQRVWCTIGRTSLVKTKIPRVGVRRCHHLTIPGKRTRLEAHQAGHRFDVNRFRQPRTLFTEAIPSILVPPLIFVGLLLALWTWKCFWIVVLQDKLLYLSWLPPLARSEKILEYERECRPVQWLERRIKSLDGTKLAVCEGRIFVPGHNDQTAPTASPTGHRKKSVVICYFQGNGGSTPLRLPLLSQVLRTINETPQPKNVEYTILALSYRGYWTSSGRATQSGIELDAQAFLDWVLETYTTPDTDLRLILWGHSLGSAIASKATATYLSRQHDTHPSIKSTENNTSQHPISGLILEAPSSSIKDMLISLYPQKWLPYRYLWPFSWNHWDCTTAMDRLARWRDHRDTVQGKHESCEVDIPSPRRTIPPILLLSVQNDEVIPPHVADGLEADAKRLGLSLERKDVKGALHTEAPIKLDGREALVQFIFRSTSEALE